MEIEKKFLTKQIPFDISKFPHTEIEQSYISTDPVIRIRKSGNSFILTVKGSGHISREEYEIPLNEKQYNNLAKKSDSDTILKTRYFIPLGCGLTAETDIYHGQLNGLITTEVEFKTSADAQSFAAPQWFGIDISLDSRYKNASLAINGLPKNLYQQ